MNTNNVTQGLEAGAKKIALAGLVFVTALVFTVIAMNPMNPPENKTESAIAAATTYDDCVKNPKNMSCETAGGVSTATCDQGGAVLSKTCTSGYGCDIEGSGGKCATTQCIYDASSLQGQTKECANVTGGTYYCMPDGYCRIGCVGYTGNTKQLINANTKTCAKPDAGGIVAVYQCVPVPVKNLVNENSGASQQNISVDSNNMVTTTNVYSLVAIDGKTCDGGDGMCANNDCSHSSGCDDKGDAIKNVIEKYLNEKDDIIKYVQDQTKIINAKIINGKPISESEKTTQIVAMVTVKKKEFTDILNKVHIGSSGDGVDSGDAAKLMKIVEKMIFKDQKGPLWEQKNDGSLPLFEEGDTVELDQILCQISNTPGNLNSWCPANKTKDAFWGYDYGCTDYAGCKMYEWVLGKADKCDTDTNNGNIDSFSHWLNKSYTPDLFTETIGGKEVEFGLVRPNSNDYDGELTGGASNGCSYKSIVQVSHYDDSLINKSGFFQSPTEYREVNKAFTGVCWDKAEVSATGEDKTQGQNQNEDGCLTPPSNDCATQGDLTSGSTGSTSDKYSVGTYICSGKVPYVCSENLSWDLCSNDPNTNTDDCKNACKCLENSIGECSSNDDCSNTDELCLFANIQDYNAKKGVCSPETQACLSKSNLDSNGIRGAFSKGAVVCEGSSGDSVICSNPSGSIYTGWSPKTDCEGKGCDTKTGECIGKEGEEGGGECKDISITKGNAKETTSACGNKSCNGVCVPFTVQETGDCSEMTCTVNNDYDGGKATGYRSGTGSQWYACMTPKLYSSSDSSDKNSKGSSPSTINYLIKCTDSKSGQTDTVEGSCNAPQNDDNNFKKAEDEVNENKAKEGEKCEKDSDCQDGLVCEDGKCMTQEEAEKASEGESCSKDSDCQEGLVCGDNGKCVTEDEANLEAPTVSITAPSGTVTAKTAQLSVTTNISASCKYMDITNGGSFDGSSFGGSGMTMSSSGYTHIATLTSLADTNTTNNSSSDCKKTHNLVVLCQNSKATNQSNTNSIGSAQTSFTVDLSGVTEYAPTVTNAMTGTSFTVANPVLKVNTNQPASCQYKEGSTFTYGSGTDFTTTGSYNHNTELSGLTSKDYTYYVVCKDVATCAASTALTLNFKVALEGGDSSMTIASATAANQTVSNPTLAVTTDIPAICQYSTSSFTYGSGTQFANDNDYSHTSSLSTLADGSYSFYISCKEKESGKIKNLTTAIQTTLNRSGVVEGEPVVSNTTAASQSTGSPILSITTTLAAKCQYKESEFTYGSGTQFTTDGDTGHSVQLKNIADGDHTYYVVCKDTATGKTNSTPVEITFTVSNTAAVCADLDSNDRQSDEDRDYNDDDSSDSKYAWRSIESGTRDQFTNVDWYAGYQFTPDKDGYVSQLCGYFEEDQSNDVILYNGSYKELAKTTVEGSGDWECVSITPVSVKTDKRYYVVARVKNGPIFYEYESGLLPGDADNVVVESGVRQLGDQDFGEDVFKYDYMVFGLVDVKMSFADESEEGPSVDIEGPIGSIDKNSTSLSVSTDENATCKFSREDVEYSDMEYDFGRTGGKTHEQKICKLDDGNFTFYVRCKNEDGDENDASALIQFEVGD